MKKIKKEDRAFLYYRQNSNGRLNMKFGPEKYHKDTSKFSEMLFSGTLYGVSFLASLSSELGEEFREKQYEDIGAIFNSILNDSFPDIYEKKKKELLMEEEAIEAVEKGKDIPEETLEKIQATKQKVKERIAEKQSIKDYNKKTIELMEDEKERIEKELKEINAFLDERKDLSNGVVNAIIHSKATLEEGLERLNKDLAYIYENEKEEKEQA